jgi:hypothetical protein
VNQRYVIAAFGENRFHADMIFILFVEFVFCPVRGHRCEAFEADGIEGAILVASTWGRRELSEMPLGNS